MQPAGVRRGTAALAAAAERGRRNRSTGPEPAGAPAAEPLLTPEDLDLIAEQFEAIERRLAGLERRCGAAEGRAANAAIDAGEAAARLDKRAPPRPAPALPRASDAPLARRTERLVDKVVGELERLASRGMAHERTIARLAAIAYR
eukprot:tig00020927_g15973.t1